MVGQMHRIVHFLDERHTAFAVSRLIMLSGVQVRRYSPDAVDDPALLKRVMAGLKHMLSAADLAELERYLNNP
jgi:hypothetical protein